MIIINPGTGPVSGEPQAALAAVKALFADAGVGILRTRYRGVEFDGRYGFSVTTMTHNHRAIELSVPGVPLSRLRDDRDPYQPRLYVDGDSWIWEIAVGRVRFLAHEGA